MLTNFTKKNAPKYLCESCDFNCSNKYDYSRHLNTRKHYTLTHINEIVDENSQKKTQKTQLLFPCSCGKVYKYRQSLFEHKKKCNPNTNVIEEKNETDETDISNKELIKMLIKENTDFKHMILDIVKNIQPNNTNNTNNNTNNNFNLHFFLNTTCKDAINLVDFVESLQVQLKDLEETARLGYSEGVSKIFINGLSKLDVTMRPIHCSDAKRETLYIKNQNEWTKEDTDKSHISKAIKTVSNKNIDQIFEWQKKYPEYKDSDSKHSDKYMKMIFNTMSGATQEEQSKNLDKIIKNITKEVIIDKS